VKPLPETAAAHSTLSGCLQLEAHACYRALNADLSHHASEPNLGGKLLYAGELNGPGRAMTIAGNVAGCATLAVTADVESQKHAIRDGVVDFVVNSLDEALRIVKNEIRKRTTVSVCIGGDRNIVELEMVERGVSPDMVFAGTLANRRTVSHFDENAREILLEGGKQSSAFLMWQVDNAPARWMPKLDAIALECLADEPATQRWIRVSPRYLGRAALAERAFSCSPESAGRILRRFSEAVEDGSIGAEVSLCMADDGESKVLRLRPKAS
jgi:urocanate hydratase